MRSHVKVCVWNDRLVLIDGFHGVAAYVASRRAWHFLGGVINRPHEWHQTPLALAQRNSSSSRPIV